MSSTLLERGAITATVYARGRAVGGGRGLEIVDGVSAVQLPWGAAVELAYRILERDYQEQRDSGAGPMVQTVSVSGVAGSVVRVVAQLAGGYQLHGQGTTAAEAFNGLLEHALGSVLRMRAANLEDPSHDR